MNERIEQGIENNKGSSLAFVLIIGMVLMVMVASIMAVANSDFTFTQETVESRQAYIDAKSVIEFGKIEIKDREEKLSQANKALVEATNKKESTVLILQTIDQLEDQTTTIYGNEKNVGETLSFTTSPGDGNKILGKVSVEKSGINLVSNVASSKYVFKIITENLVRKLDYKVDFNYVVTTNTGSGTSESLVKPIAPPAPLAPNAIPAQTEDKLGDVRKLVNYTTNKDNLILSGKNIVCEGDLNIGGSATVVIKCDTLWVKGNLTIDSNTVSQIEANNIIVENTADEKKGNLIIKENSKVAWSLSGNLWVGGNIAVNTFNGNDGMANSISANNIIISNTSNQDNGKLTVGATSRLDLTCIGNLWVGGNIDINTNSGNTNMLNTISANNVILSNTANSANGSLTVGKNSRFSLNCVGNLWVGGDIKIDVGVPNANMASSISVNSIIMVNPGEDQTRGQLTVSKDSKLDLICRSNFWITGNIIINTNNGNDNMLNTISANNIIMSNTVNQVNSQMAVSKDSKLSLICVGNLWVEGNVIINTNNSNANMVNTISANNIIITKTANELNGSIILGTASLLNLNCEQTFSSHSFELQENSSMLLKSGIIKINNTFKLNKTKSVEVECKYLECSGNTSITELNSPLNFKPKNSMLNLRFAGGYEQTNSTVNIDSADMVIFGGSTGPINLAQNSKLNVKSDTIYFDSTSISIPANTGFTYAYSGKTKAVPKTFNIRKQILLKGPGNYLGFNGTKLEALSGTLTTPYEGPSWPLNADSSSIDISNGTETYY